ncbi:hypothetical protein FACUT_4223 [Fusarium acutatum]|uniref:Uncharacterized protein n=1 Tax=Fusarium acutatum TaxID=78861 RepID=A0A8H4JWD8_9HYPO|nr:hypothetical protein FACUT_4223 [Fusarium acutatum]
MYGYNDVEMSEDTNPFRTAPRPSGPSRPSERSRASGSQDSITVNTPLKQFWEVAPRSTLGNPQKRKSAAVTEEREELENDPSAKRIQTDHNFIPTPTPIEIPFRPRSPQPRFSDRSPPRSSKRVAASNQSVPGPSNKPEYVSFDVHNLRKYGGSIIRTLDQSHEYNRYRLIQLVSARPQKRCDAWALCLHRNKVRQKEPYSIKINWP